MSASQTVAGRKADRTGRCSVAEFILGSKPGGAGPRCEKLKRRGGRGVGAGKGLHKGCWGPPSSPLPTLHSAHQCLPLVRIQEKHWWFVHLEKTRVLPQYKVHSAVGTLKAALFGAAAIVRGLERNPGSTPRASLNGQRHTHTQP